MPGGYLPETQALIARFTTPPTTARAILINALIGSLITAGVWTKLDALYVMAQYDAQAARQNWIQNLYNATAVASPTFTTDRGYAGNGSSSYLTTGLNPGDGGTYKYLRNSANLGVYSRTNAADSSVDLGMRTSGTLSQSLLLLRNAVPGNLIYRVNLDAASPGVLVPTSVGHSVGVRSGASAAAAYKDAVPVATDGTASAALASFEFYIGALNSAGSPVSFSTRQNAVVHIGGSLSAGEVASLYTALNTYLVAVGAA